MTVDSYTRVVLTIIATALVYLCVVLTPLPGLRAQGLPRPGDPTGPGRVVVVGWDTADQIPVQLISSIPLKVSGDVSLNGVVETRQTTNSLSRVVLTGWEENLERPVNGQSPAVANAFRPFNARAQSPSLRGVPVTSYPPW
jgi:hypothetical protein